MIQIIKTVTRFIKERILKRPKYLQEFSTMNSEIKQIYKQRLEHLIEINQPLILISQIQRSGGTLLSQLFDNHLERRCHPDELHIGYPKKHIWPDLNFEDNPGNWFRLLFEQKNIVFFVMDIVNTRIKPDT